MTLEKVRGPLRTGQTPRSSDWTSEVGDTLIEVLITLVIIGLCGLALLTAFSATISGSAQQRSLAGNDTILRAVAESAFSQIQQQQAPWYALCAGPNDYNVDFGYFLSNQPVGFLVPAGYVVNLTMVDLQFDSTTGLWNNVAAPIASCATATSVPQLVTVTVTAPNHTNDTTSFVVDGRNGVSPSSAQSISITSVSPASLGQGQAYQTVKIYGTGFNDAASVKFSFPDSDFHVDSVQYVGPTEMDVVVSVSNVAATGSGTLTVTNPDTTIATHGFSITPAPFVVSMSPTYATVGVSENLTVVGTGFVTGLKVSFSNGAIQQGTPSSVNALGLTTSFTVPITIPPGTTSIGLASITVTNPDGSTMTSSSILNILAAPTISTPTSSTPCTLAVNATGPCTIVGTGFVSGDTVTLSSPTLGTVNSTQVVSSTQILVNLTGGAAPGTGDIIVTSPDGVSVSASGGFGVT